MMENFYATRTNQKTAKSLRICAHSWTTATAMEFVVIMGSVNVMMVSRVLIALNLFRLLLHHTIRIQSQMELNGYTSNMLKDSQSIPISRWFYLHKCQWMFTSHLELKAIQMISNMILHLDNKTTLESLQSSSQVLKLS